MLFMTVILGVTSSSLITTWILLEINFITFMGMLSSSMKKMVSQLVTYFLVQSYGSAGLILSFLVEFTSTLPLISYVLSILVLIKMGAAPFHLWFIKVMASLPWEFIWIISTWQKILPLFILSSVYSKNLLMLIVLMNSGVSCMLMMKQTTIKLIFAYSSIFTLSWILSAILASPKIWIWMVIWYMLALLMVTNTLSTLEKTYFFTPESKNSLKMKFIITVLSISGLPPFMMFFIKIYIISNMITSMALLALALMVMSVPVVYSYMMTFFTTLTMSSSEPNSFKQTLETTTLAFLMNSSAIMIISMI